MLIAHPTILNHLPSTLTPSSLTNPPPVAPPTPTPTTPQSSTPRVISTSMLMIVAQSPSPPIPAAAPTTTTTMHKALTVSTPSWLICRSFGYHIRLSCILFRNQFNFRGSIFGLYFIFENLFGCNIVIIFV